VDNEVEDENEDQDDAGEEGEGEEDEEDEEDEGTEESEEAKGEIEGTAEGEAGDDIEDEAKDTKHKEDTCEEPRMPVSAAARPQKEVIHAAATDWNHKSTSNAAQSTAEPASPAITAMAAVAAAATVAAAMAQAQKEMSPHVNSQDKIGSAGSGAADSLAALQADASGGSPQASQAMTAAAAAIAAAAAAGVSPAVSQAMLQGATPGGGGGPGGGLVPVGWAAQGMAGAMAGAMAGLGAHQLAMQKWARMAGLPMPGSAEADKASGQSPAGLLQASLANSRTRANSVYLLYWYKSTITDETSCRAQERRAGQPCSSMPHSQRRQSPQPKARQAQRLPSASAIPTQRTHSTTRSMRMHSSTPHSTHASRRACWARRRRCRLRVVPQRVC